MKKVDISNLIVTKIHDVYSYTLKEDTEGSATSRSSMLILKLKGASEYTVGSKTYTADENTIVYIPAGVEYSLYVDKAGECIVAEFDAVGDTEGEVCEFITGGESEIIASAKSVLHYWKLKGPAYHSKCLSELYSLITQISTVHSYTYSLAGKYPLIHKSVKYIERNYRREDLYTPALAEMSGIGETYYRSIFISVFQVPPARYIQNYRVEKAKQLLVNSSGSIEEIATAVGFANSSYFCKVFKSTTGLTPTEFAAKSRTVG
ncbi:MAG: helix-turn-helix transcriptional regulator [Ruminococcaceae bacterium]|nr:helix-turn-helix transcriptional regulator [Oscillospiraceae bacterium]